MRLEKLPLRNFDTPVMPPGAPVAKRPFVPASLVPEPVVEQAPPEPVAPTFSEDDLKQAEQEGYRKGFLEGTREGHMQAQSEQAEVDRALTEAMGGIAAALHASIQEYNRMVAKQKEELPPLALAIARKVAGQALEANALPLVEEIVTACVSRLLGEPHIVVTVNAKLSDALEQRLSAHFAHSSEPGEISIQGDEHLHPGDCRIEWANGNAHRSTEELWQQMNTIIHDMVVGSRPREADAHPAHESPAPPSQGETPQPL